MENELKENLNVAEAESELDSESETNEQAVEPQSELLASDNGGKPEQVKPKTKKQQFVQLVIFTLCMASAGVIQFVTTGLLSTWTGLMSEDSGYYWIAYLVGLVLSVIWSFTFNRKFTFKAASNLPLAMLLVALYYCAFAPLSTFGADAIVKAWQTAAGDNWDQNYEMVITVGMMLINFVTEFFWEKFVVFNDSVMAKIERKLHIKHKNKNDEQNADEAAEEGLAFNDEEAVAENATASPEEANADKQAEEPLTQASTNTESDTM